MRSTRVLLVGYGCFAVMEECRFRTQDACGWCGVFYAVFVSSFPWRGSVMSMPHCHTERKTTTNGVRFSIIKSTPTRPHPNCSHAAHTRPFRLPRTPLNTASRRAPQSFLDTKKYLYVFCERYAEHLRDHTLIILSILFNGLGPGANALHHSGALVLTLRKGRRQLNAYSRELCGRPPM